MKALFGLFLFWINASFFGHFFHNLLAAPLTYIPVSLLAGTALFFTIKFTDKELRA